MTNQGRQYIICSEYGRNKFELKSRDDNPLIPANTQALADFLYTGICSGPLDAILDVFAKRLGSDLNKYEFRLKFYDVLEDMSKGL